MKKGLFSSWALGLFFGLQPLPAAEAHLWEISSPEHEQTFAYGSERSRAWEQRGNHLVLFIHFTNDPYVNIDEPRLYDDFSFDFPNVTLGPDHRTFYYHPGKGTAVPVAARQPGLFGEEIRLLPSSFLVTNKPHGWLTLTLVANDRPFALNSD
jgi:hypothetical protein